MGRSVISVTTQTPQPWFAPRCGFFRGSQYRNDADSRQARYKANFTLLLLLLLLLVLICMHHPVRTSKRQSTRQRKRLSKIRT
jgi:hypothetical protein